MPVEFSKLTTFSNAKQLLQDNETAKGAAKKYLPLYAEYGQIATAIAGGAFGLQTLSNLIMYVTYPTLAGVGLLLGGTFTLLSLELCLILGKIKQIFQEDPSLENINSASEFVNKMVESTLVIGSLFQKFVGVNQNQNNPINGPEIDASVFDETD